MLPDTISPSATPRDLFRSDQEWNRLSISYPRHQRSRVCVVHRELSDQVFPSARQSVCSHLAAVADFHRSARTPLHVVPRRKLHARIHPLAIRNFEGVAGFAVTNALWCGQWNQLHCGMCLARWLRCVSICRCRRIRLCRRRRSRMESLRPGRIGRARSTLSRRLAKQASKGHTRSICVVKKRAGVVSFFPWVNRRTGLRKSCDKNSGPSY